MIKKLIQILIVFILLIAPVYAKTEKGALEYNKAQYCFNSGDEKKFLQKANQNMELFEKSLTKENKEYYLKEAMKYYFLVEKIDKACIEAQIGLGRVYDELKQDSLAQKHFFNAYNFDHKNPKFNFYFGNYYYKRNDLVTAFHYYDLAYKYGYSHDCFMNYRLGVLSEKLAEIELAKDFYKKALDLNSKFIDLKAKINSLEALNYSQSQYYLFKK